MEPQEPPNTCKHHARAHTAPPTRAGQTNYDDLYADIRKWLKEGWIDYVVPQIYFHIGFEAVDYEKTLRWWRDNSFGKKLYIGMAPYRIGADKAPQWSEPTQMPRQLRINYTYPDVHGVVYFNARKLIRNPLGFADSLQMDFYRRPALWPVRSQLTQPALPSPKLKTVQRVKGGLKLKWDWPTNPTGLGHLVIYKFPAGMEANTELPGAVYRIIPSDQLPTNEFMDTQGLKGQKYQYRISALNRNHLESTPSNTLKSRRFPAQASAEEE